MTDETQVECFRQNPDRYEPAFGGWCAFGMSVDKRFRIDPNKFKIVDERLLVFLNDLETDARSLWDQGHDTELLAEAEAAWESYSARSAA